MQQNIDRLRAAVAGHGTVVASVLQLIAGFVAQVRDARDDPEEIDAITNEIDAQSSRLAAAIAQDTIASDEIAPADGGTGDDESVVDLDSVDLEDLSSAGGAGGGEDAGDAAGAGGQVGEGAGSEGVVSDGSVDGGESVIDGDVTAADGEGDEEQPLL